MYRISGKCHTFLLEGFSSLEVRFYCRNYVTAWFMRLWRSEANNVSKKAQIHTPPQKQQWRCKRSFKMLLCIINILIFNFFNIPHSLHHRGEIIFAEISVAAHHLCLCGGCVKGKALISNCSVAQFLTLIRSILVRFRALFDFRCRRVCECSLHPCLDATVGKNLLWMLEAHRE